MRFRTLSVVSALGSLSVAIAAAQSPAQGPPQVAAKRVVLSEYYGFHAPEIYKLDSRIQNLILRDVNQDGLLDVVVVNPLRNRIDVLEQRKDPNDRSAIPMSTEVNEIVNDWRLKHRKIPATRGIGALEVADVNGDGLVDLVYLGDPPGLYVEYQRSDGTFSRHRSFDLPDAQRTLWSLDVGDLNGDGRKDIAFLGKSYLYIVYQDRNGDLAEPVRFRLSEDGANLIRVLDFNEDGRNDIVYLTEDAQFPVRARFQTQSGRPGPERRFSPDKPRGISYANVDGKPGIEMLSISDLSDRLQIYSLAVAEKDELRPTSQLVTFPFERAGTVPTTDLVVADFDGDRRADVLMSDSDSSRLTLFRQIDAEGLDLGVGYPAMQGVRSLRVIDLDGDGKAEALALSDKENAIGWTTFRDNRLVYPMILPTRDEPVAMEVLGTGASQRLAYVARARDPSTRSDRFYLRMLRPERSGNLQRWTPARFDSADQLPLELPGKPIDMKAIDAHGDGILDLLLLFDFQAPLVLVGTNKGSFTPAPALSAGALGTISPAAVFFQKLDEPQPSFVVAQANFARKMRLSSDHRWNVLDAINAADANASITGLEALDLDGDGLLELALYDRNARSVLFFKKRDGLYRQWRQLRAGAFALRGMRVADFDHDGKHDLLLFDSDKMGIAYTGKQDLELRQIAMYETDIRNGRLFDNAAADLNGDGRIDILVLEQRQHTIEIVALLPENRLERVLRWPVFEEKTFRRDLGGIEPREVALGDVNGDGRSDIVVLVHNRVLVYLQDRGEAKTAAADPAAGSKRPQGKASPTAVEKGTAPAAQREVKP